MRSTVFAAIALASLGLAGCKSGNDRLITGSIGAAPVERATSEAGWRAIADKWRPSYDKNPQDARAAMSLGHALRMLSQSSQAVAVLQTAAVKNPRNKVLLGEYGRALAENGQFQQALDVFQNAHSPDQPNWRILMAQGAVLDQLERGGEARGYYETALKMQPSDPSLLSNYGLSYALSGDLANAEAVLRRAYAAPQAGMRVRQNLALVLALAGKYQEAEQVASRDLSPGQASQNIAYIKGMMSQGNTWKKLKRAPTPDGEAG